ncbi:MAG: Methionyl-tRNA formyltransferase [Candidatus Hydrogenedentes bacterium ADurb.Bin179]|nr:MAG: Methionyl-tRNA formyltransferase [Candidatus Hydrogenedentes bacterium ADurb.Bin179]
MRIVFFGTPPVAVPTLALLAAEHDVTAVVTQPDRPRGRSGRPEPSAVKVWALENGLPVYQPEKLHDGAFEAWLCAQQPDSCVLAAYGRFLKQPLLDVPPLGWLNLHPSLLPRWRGPSPIQTALLEGDAETGVTIMRVVLEMDAGDIVLQESTLIGPEETAGDLTERLAAMGAPLMARALVMLEQGNAPSIPQDTARVTNSTLFEKERGRIHWADTSRRIHDQVRACNPWPMTYACFRGQTCRILKTRWLSDAPSADPGVVLDVRKDRILVAAGEGQLSLLRLQLPGKKALDVDAFLRGTPVTPGERFEDVP